MRVIASLKRKRALLPLVSILFLAGATWAAVARSDRSRIIVYNQTGAPIAALKVSACDQVTVFRHLDDEGSFRWKLAPAGVAGEIELETAAEPPWRWRGASIQPRGGYRVTLRLWPDGQVEVHTQTSLWQQLFKGVPRIDE